jgi:hypothetical protein
MKPNNLLKTLGVFLAGCLVALAGLEVLLRAYNPLEIRFRPDRIVLPVNKRYVIDNAGKFTKLPPSTLHTKNRLGFRGQAPPRDFPDYLTIITIGGSTTECFYLSDGRTSWGKDSPASLTGCGSTTPAWMAPPPTGTSS